MHCDGETSFNPMDFHVYANVVNNIYLLLNHTRLGYNP